MGTDTLITPDSNDVKLKIDFGFVDTNGNSHQLEATTGSTTEKETEENGKTDH